MKTRYLTGSALPDIEETLGKAVAASEGHSNCATERCEKCGLVLHVQRGNDEHQFVILQRDSRLRRDIQDSSFADRSCASISLAENAMPVGLASIHSLLW